MTKDCYNCLHDNDENIGVDWEHQSEPCNKCEDLNEFFPANRSHWEAENFQTACKAKYGSTFMVTSQLKKPFEVGTRCFSCAKDAVKRIDANIWGTVQEFDMCASHAKKYDGKLVETVASYDEWV